MPTPRLVEFLAPDCFASLHLPGGWCQSNAAFVTGDAATVIVDTTATEAQARQLAGAVAMRRRSERTVIVNTHHHGDHTFGNSLFPGATVVAHHALTTEAVAAGHGLTDLFPDVAWGEVPLVLPHLTYRVSATLDTGDRRVELRHPGIAHTSNDTVVWLPEDGLLITGDVAMNGVTPFWLMGSSTGMLAALEELATLDPAIVVPGHGPTGGAGILHAQARYVAWVLDIAERGMRRALPPTVAATSAPVPPEFARWIDPERTIANVHRTYSDLSGQPLDLLATYQEMVRGAGGELCCAA